MKFVSKYRCEKCHSEVILIRDFPDVESGRAWQNTIEKHARTCGYCSVVPRFSEQHRQHLERAQAYADRHCWVSLHGDPETVLEANAVRCAVAHQINSMLRFSEIRYMVVDFLGEFFLEHRDAEWWVQYDAFRPQAEIWSDEFARWCDIKCIDLPRIYLNNLTAAERLKTDDEILTSPLVRTKFPAVYTQYVWRKQRGRLCKM